MGLPANFLATSGTGAAPITAPNFNTLVQGGGTLATLRGFTGIQYMTVYMIGYVSPNDGGEGNFYWNTVTGTDDGGVTTIVPNGSTSGCWSRLGTAPSSNAYTSSSVNGNIVSLTSANPTNITSIALASGTWIVWGNIVFQAATSTTITLIGGGIGEVSAILPSPPDGGGSFLLSATLTTGGTQSISVGQMRLNLTVPTTIYLVAQANFGTSTMTAGGFLGALPSK